jgi:hypothetical protein
MRRLVKAPGVPSRVSGICYGTDSPRSLKVEPCFVEFPCEGETLVCSIEYRYLSGRFHRYSLQFQTPPSDFGSGQVTRCAQCLHNPCNSSARMIFSGRLVLRIFLYSCNGLWFLKIPGDLSSGIMLSLRQSTMKQPPCQVFR